MRSLRFALAAALATIPALAGPAPGPRSFGGSVLPLSEVARLELPPVDVEGALAADAARAQKPVPHRVAVVVPLAGDPTTSGTWEKLADGGSLWRLRVASPGAVFLSAKFSEFDLPPGATLHLVSAHHDYFAGPFSERHNRPERRFGSPMIPGDEVIVELYLPPGSTQATLDLESVSHGFRDPLGMTRVATRGAAPAGSFGCQRDINCPAGAPYQDVKRAVAEGYDGAFVCSGTMLNNVRQDNRLFYLTAAHCEFWRDPPTMEFYWNYENSGCGTNDAPFTFSTGSVNRYRNTAADIHLLELSGATIDDTYDIYFAGWSRATSAPTSAAVIGFPDDKPKQIAIENDPVVDCAPSGCFDGWGANWWRVLGYDVGVTEVGSSGSGLLNQDQQVVGTLTGGVGTDCADFEWDEYAKIAPVWNSLRPFLDPDNTGAVSLAGRDHADFPAAPPVADGETGSAMLLSKGAGTTIGVSYDAATCSGDHAVMLWGNLGDWTGYQGSVGPGCNLGNSGSGSFTFAGSNVWFNLVWVDPGAEAGHPGYSSAGPRTWSAAGLCGTTGDDVADPSCD